MAAMQCSAARAAASHIKTVNLAASFSCALKNKGLEMLRGEMILISLGPFGVNTKCSTNLVRCRIKELPYNFARNFSAKFCSTVLVIDVNNSGFPLPNPTDSTFRCLVSHIENCCLRKCPCGLRGTGKSFPEPDKKTKESGGVHLQVN